ncbi:hypothetical protein EMIT07CA2_550082 [Brevibacillus sp. IT-7CA2]
MNFRLVKTKSGIIHVISHDNSGRTMCGTRHNQVQTHPGSLSDITCSKCQKKLNVS